MKPYHNKLFRRGIAALALSSVLALPVAAQIGPTGSDAFAIAQHYDPVSKSLVYWQAQVNLGGNMQITQATSLGATNPNFPALTNLDSLAFPSGVLCIPQGGSKATLPWRALNVQPILLAEDSNTADLFFACNLDPNNTSLVSIAFMRFNGNTWNAYTIAGNVNPLITGFGAFTWDAVPEWPGEEAFMVYRDTNPTPTISVVEMLPGSEGVSGTILGGIHPPVGATGWDGNVSACLSTNTLDPDPDAPKILWLSISTDQGIYVGCTKFGAIDTSGQGHLLSDGAMRWTLFKPTLLVPMKTRTSANLPAQNLHLGADGNVYLTYLESNGNAFDMYKITGGPTQGITFSSDQIEHFDRGPVGLNGFGSVPTALYTYGTPTNATDNSTTVGVNRTMLWRRDTDYKSATSTYRSETTSFGSAQRTAIAKINHDDTMQSLLVGIIDGPPPVPNENIKNGPGNASNFGFTRYGQTVGQSTDTNFSTSLELIAKAKAKAGGLFASVSTEAELDIGGNVKWGNSTESSVLTSYQTLALPVQENGAWKVLANGTAFLWESSYTGFTYQFLDPSGNVVPDAPQYLQIMPVDSKITAYPFAYDPNATSGIIPGELQTYLMSSTDRQNLEQNSAYTFTGSNGSISSIYYSWAEGGSVGEEAETISSHYLGGGVDVNFELLVGAEANVGFFEGKVQGGFDFTFNWDTNTTDSVKNQIATEVEFPVAQEAPGVYQRYSYHVLNLKENNAYCQELINRLRSYNDPAGNNANLLKRIVVNSAPWKITYAIDQNPDGTGDYYQIPAEPLGAAAAKTAPIPASLVAKGITSQRQIAQLHGALLQGNKRIAAGRPGALPAEVHAKLATLTPQERSTLTNYVKTQQASSRKQFQMRHPNWKPSTFPDPKTNLPSFYGKRPAKGAAVAGTPALRLSPKWFRVPQVQIKR